MLEFRRKSLWRRAVQRVAVLFRGHLRDDRDGRRYAANGVHRRADLVQVAERLEDEQIDPAIGQSLSLFAEILARLVDTGLAPRLDAHAQRSDRAGDISLFASRVSRQLRALDVDGVQFVGETEGSELDAVRAERVGLDDVRAGPHVLLVYFGDQIRLRQVQRVEALVDEDALRVQHRPHRAIANEYPFRECVEKRLLHGFVSHRSVLKVSASMSR